MKNLFLFCIVWLVISCSQEQDFAKINTSEFLSNTKSYITYIDNLEVSDENKISEALKKGVVYVDEKSANIFTNKKLQDDFLQKKPEFINNKKDEVIESSISPLAFRSKQPVSQGSLLNPGFQYEDVPFFMLKRFSTDKLAYRSFYYSLISSADLTKRSTNQILTSRKTTSSQFAYTSSELLKTENIPSILSDSKNTSSCFINPKSNSYSLSFFNNINYQDFLGSTTVNAKTTDCFILGYYFRASKSLKVTKK